MNVLVCVKRVPDTGARMELAAGGKTIETRNLGFTISPHEECAVEEGVRLVEKFGGSATVLTLGPVEAEEQLRDCMARGMDRGVLLETDGSDWDPVQTAAAIVEAVRAQERSENRPDLILFGNESADSGGFQVGIRVAVALDLLAVTGVKRLEMQGNFAHCRREASTGWEVFRIPLPAVVTVKEGLNLPRYPSLRGTMMARKKPVERIHPTKPAAGLELVRLQLPPDQGTTARILGHGKDAAPQIVAMLKQLEVL